MHVQNATLAGGVAVGTMADLVLKPWGAIFVGMAAGTISTLGYAYVTVRTLILGGYLWGNLNLHGF